ncbi:V-ATPase V1 sector subunit E [Apophysomyces ossiformis]|uniref:V-ATPase V1 sector subunit E n=1 Tax=Apophysomyces ossiformis TaxID=679940 RepID=A0A8H7BIR0_9FUNG|nr:V-ATPase V1 sector subunit E [Apophysomyces ossiformis]
MTTVRPLNDDEVFNEMKKMVSFIKQEALEKAREIRADEEFNIEKAKIVRQESLNIEAVFERKLKQAEVQKRIAQSNHINKARLRTLQERQAVLENLFEEARARIHNLSSDEDQYATLLENLVLQGVYALMEPEVEVQCREADSEMVRFAVERAAQAYIEKTQQSITISVSEEYLPASNAGGVVVTGLQGKIRVDNTLEARLETVKEEMLPKLRATLFGHSPNRRFFN